MQIYTLCTHTGVSSIIEVTLIAARRITHELRVTTVKMKTSFITLYITIAHRRSKCMCMYDWNAFSSFSICVYYRLHQRILRMSQTHFFSFEWFIQYIRPLSLFTWLTLFLKSHLQKNILTLE